MKYSCSIEINKPLAEVVKLWNNESLFDKWQDGFQSIELLEGEKGQENAKSRIVFLQGKRRMDLIETIVHNDLPKEKMALYDHIHMSNTQRSVFVETEEKSTIYTSEVEYVKFHGILPKLMAKFFPSAFKKQSEKWMKQFKKFAENE